jgi:hypothetical protein
VPRRRTASTVAIATALLLLGVIACFASYAPPIMVGTHTGTAFDRAIFPWRGSFVCVTTRDPRPLRFRSLRAERLMRDEAGSVVERLTSMVTWSKTFPGLHVMSDPSRSPGFSGVGHKTLFVSGWLILLLAVCGVVAAWYVDPASYLRRLRQRRGFEVMDGSHAVGLKK